MSAPRRQTPFRISSALCAATLLLAGCGSPSPGERDIAALQAAIDLLKSINDPSSANFAAAKLQPTFAELSAALGATTAPSEDSKTAKADANELRKSQGQIRKLTNELQIQSDRLNKLKGLPAEFWNVFRVQWYQLNSSLAAHSGGDPSLAAAVGQINGMLQQYGPAQTVQLELKGLAAGDKDAAVKRIHALIGDSGQVVDFAKPSDAESWLVAVAPVPDFDKLMTSIDFGKVSDQDKAKAEAAIELAPATDAQRAASASAAATAKQSAEGTTQAADGSQQAAAEPTPPADAAQAQAEPGRPTSPDAAATPGETPPGEAGGAAPNLANTSFLYRLQVAAVQQQAVLAEKAVNGPQPSDSNYHAELAELLFKPDSPHHEKAVTALLEVKPADVHDKKVRARIAQGYRQVAFGAGTHVADGVKGLVLWGGKFSAPLLIQLLEKESGSGADEAIYEGLGKVATPEAATAVVKHLKAGTGGGGEAAFASLKAMGPVAEPALMSAMPFDSPESNRAAVDVLGEIGTRKSGGMLRRAAKSENPAVKEAADKALESLKAREVKAKPPAAAPSPKK